jgi:lipopolysaccharide cholinephosphotransferase
MNNFNLRELQLCELDILKKVTDAFENNGLSYFALFGTLIGAVRHEGFIPWDDDIDIGMPRKHYDDFIANADKILPEGLQILHYTKNWRVPNKICRIENKNTTMAPLDKNGNIVEWQKHGVQIDIFPIDGVPVDKEKQKQFFKKIRNCMDKDTWFRQQISKHYSLKHNLFLFAISPIVVILGRTYYIEKYNKLLRSFEANKTGLVSNAGMYYGEFRICPSNVFSEYEYKKFENLKLRCPKNYDLLLKLGYGDYLKLPPKEEQIPLHTAYKYDFTKSYLEN